MRLDVAWKHRGTANHIQVEIDEPMPELENRIRTVAYLATSEAALRVMLGHMLGADYLVGVHELVAGDMSVRLTRRVLDGQSAMDGQAPTSDARPVQSPPTAIPGDGGWTEGPFTAENTVLRQVVRIFHARVKPGQERAWEEFMDEQVALEAFNPPSGLVRSYRGTPIEGKSREFIFISIWRDWDSVRAYAGASAGPVLIRNQAELADTVSVEHYELV